MANTFDQFDNQFDQFDKVELPWYQKKIPLIGISVSSGDPIADLKRGTLLSGRSILNAVTAIPNAAMDAGIGIRNMITGENNELPSVTWSKGLNDLGLPQPQGAAEKIGDFGLQMLVGSKLPTPQAGSSESLSIKGVPIAPAGIAGEPLSKTATSYTPVDAIKLQTLRKAQQQGLVVPPSTTNPTLTNKILESAGGKIATAQDASAQNMDQINSMAKQALGLHQDTPITPSVLNAVRDEAGNAYEVVRGVGRMRADSQYAKDLANILAKYKGAEVDFPELANPQVEKLVTGMQKGSFDSNSVVDALKILRENAGKAYSSGDKTLGAANRDIATALEDAVQRGLERRGENGADILSAFKNARATIAKSYSVEKALNQSTGNIEAVKLAQQLSKKAPLSGELKDIATFAQAFPKATQAINDSGSVRNTDVILGAGSAALSKEPNWLLYPFARMAVRKMLLSGVGQKLAVPSTEAESSAKAMMNAQALARFLGPGQAQQNGQ